LRPRVIVLDEPTTDLDPEGKAEVFALIRKLREQGLSLMVIEHETEELRKCDRLLLLRDGEIVAQGTPDAVLTRLELLESCGVHPPDLNRALAMIGIHSHAVSIDDAEAMLRRVFVRGSGATPARHNVDGSQHDFAERGRAVLKANVPTEGTAPLVETEGVSFSYALGPRVLDEIEVRIRPGEFVAIVGQNGSGKTTLAKHLVGLLRPSHGRVLLQGRDRATLRPVETAHLTGYVFQNPDHQIFASSVEEEVAFGPRNFGMDPGEVEHRVDEVLRAVNLQTARQRDPFLLSKGERQRLAVASVLALRPRLLILDEPTTGLDYREQRRMMELITELNRSGIAIIIITHAPWLVAEYARRVILMRRGRILFDGSVRAFFQQDDLLKQSSFRPPEVMLLARRFGIDALNPEEFAAAMQVLNDTAVPPC
jgi:energy-coupling factor transporter ATP-binding protein EcfA2